MCVCVQELADEKLVEWQISVQAVEQSKVEIQLLYKLLQDLQTSMTKAQQQQEEVRSESMQEGLGHGLVG